jgi:hypothetical protein
MSITQASIKPYILIGAIVFGLVVPLIVWFLDKTIPPLLLIIFVSLGITCVIHSVLGGTDATQFKVAAATLGGGGALFFIFVWFLNPILERQMQHNQTVEVSAAQNKQAAEFRQQLEAKSAELTRLGESVKALETSIARSKQTLLVDAIAQIKDLRRGNEIADALVEMERKREGPWSPTSEEIAIRVSVAGYLTGRNAAVCKGLNLKGRKVDVTSTLVVDGQNYRAEQPVMIDSWSLISDQVCGEDRKFDVQIGCQLAEEIFTSDVVRCNGKQPAWQGEFKNLLPAAAVLLYEP